MGSEKVKVTVRNIPELPFVAERTVTGMLRLSLPFAQNPVILYTVEGLSYVTFTRWELYVVRSASSARVMKVLKKP